MKQVAHQARAEARPVGFVPTMGALHEGHMSLVRAAMADCRPVIASIFVNPAQFGPGEDLQNYPRTFESDRKRLEEAGVGYLFAPEAGEMYPQGFRTWVNVEGLSDRLEGRVRPGHFRAGEDHESVNRRVRRSGYRLGNLARKRLQPIG